MWYSILENKTSNAAEIRIYGEIGLDVSAEQFAADLDELGEVDLDLRINSPGGSVFEGLGIYNRLKSHKGQITATVEGIAASMGSVIAMAADLVVMHSQSMLMVHNPATAAYGDQRDLQRAADTLGKVRELIADAYGRANLSRKRILAAMDEETWFTADEAAAAGLADEVIAADDDDLDIAACVQGFDLTKFQYLPEEFNQMTTNTNQPTAMNPDAMIEAEFHAEMVTKLFGRYPQHEALRLECLARSMTYSEAAERLLQAIGRDEEASEGDFDVSMRRPTTGVLQGSGARVHSNIPNDFRAAAADVVCMRGGVKIKNPHPATRDFIRMSLVDMAATCLRAGGENTASMNPAAIVGAAFSHTSSDFPNLLADVANKSLLMGYQDEPYSATWTTELSVPDFKPAHFPQLSSAPNLLLVLESGEFKEGSFGESDESMSLLTYGRLFNISRQAIVNDDQNAFTRVPRAMGQAARRKELDLIYDVLISNPTMGDGTALFHADHNNLASSGAALAVASLSDARTAMRKQTTLSADTSSANQYLNIVPRYLIVPAALESLAEQLIASLVDPAKSNDTPNLEFVRGLELVVDARLDADSETAWYLAAGQQQIETVGRAYLESDSSVFLESSEGWTVDGISFKVRQDFAAAALDFRGLHKDPGA